MPPPQQPPEQGSSRLSAVREVEEAGLSCLSSGPAEEVEAYPSSEVAAVAVVERLGRLIREQASYYFSMHLFSCQTIPSFPWPVLAVQAAQVAAELPLEEAGVVEPAGRPQLVQEEQEGLRVLLVGAEGVAEGRRLEELED